MKQILILLMSLSMTSVSFANKIDIPQTIEAAEQMPLHSDADSLTNDIRGALLDFNIGWHQVLFYLSDHPCVAADTCNSYTDYQYLTSGAKDLAIKTIAFMIIFKIIVPGKTGVKRLAEAVTNDGWINTAKLFAMGSIMGGTTLYFYDYMNFLTTVSPEEQKAMLDELRLARKAIGVVDYSAVSNIFGTLGISQLFGVNTVQDMAAQIQEMQKIMEAGPTQR